MSTFARVAELGGFSAAARALNLSPPMVTRAVATLEDHLGVRLFERTTRSVRLTDAGREFVAVAQRIANDLRITAESMREIADQHDATALVVEHRIECIETVCDEVVFLYKGEAVVHEKTHDFLRPSHPRLVEFLGPEARGTRSGS